MNKKALFLSLILSTNVGFASLLWNIDYGVKEFYKGNLNNAKNYFITYLKSNPNDENGYFWLAKTYDKLGLTDQSVENFEKAYQINYQKKELGNLNFNSDYIKNAEDYFDMAVEYFGSGNYKEADFYADMMLKLNAKSASAYFIKAKIAKTLKNEQEAREYLNQAIIFNHDILKTNLAKNLKITKIPETTKEIYKYYALELYYKGEIQEAIINAKKYYELDNDIDMANFLAELYLKEGNLDNLKDLLAKIKADGNANIQTKIIESKILKEKDKIEKALLEGYKINPNNQDALQELGNFYLKNEDFKNANKYFEALIVVNSSFYEGYFGYIYSSLKLNQTDKVLHLIREATKLNQDSSEISFLLALVCENNKSYFEAIDYLKEALKKDENPNYHFEIGKIYYALGNYEEALEYFKLAQNKEYNIINQAKLEEYLLKNYIKLKKINDAQRTLQFSKSLDKNTLLYKYNLYNLCKLDNNNLNECSKNFKLPKLVSEKDFVDASEIIFDKKSTKEALKLVNRGLVKYPDSADLLFHKNRLEYLSSN